MTLPAPQSQFTGVTMSPNLLGGGDTRASGSPGPKAGFSRITSGDGAGSHSTSQAGTPVPADRTKVAFGFGMKRKADEDGSGTPPMKRR